MRCVATTSARPMEMEMRGRQMQGWLRVGPQDLRTKRHLAKWVELGTTYAAHSPPSGNQRQAGTPSHGPRRAWGHGPSGNPADALCGGAEGFEPLTPCMPLTSQPLTPHRLPAVLLSALVNGQGGTIEASLCNLW